MMMKKTLPLLLALAIVLSGCLVMPGDDVDVSDQDNKKTKEPTEEEPPNKTIPPSPPTATVRANVTNGTVPLNVTFELDGSVDENRTLAWGLDLGDGNQTNGTSLPAAVHHTYLDATNRTVVFAVSDGSTNATTDVKITIHPQIQSKAPDIYLVGDGSTTGSVTPDDAMAFILEEETSTFDLSTQGHGGDEAAYVTSGPWNTEAWGSPFVPTFLGTEPVKLSGQPVTLVTFVASTSPINEIEDEICPLTASLFDAEGNLIIAEAEIAFPRLSPPAPAGPIALNFTFEPEPGEYAGLGVQFGTTFLECAMTPVQWVWGSDDHPGRIVFAEEDVLLE